MYKVYQIYLKRPGTKKLKDTNMDRQTPTPRNRSYESSTTKRSRHHAEIQRNLKIKVDHQEKLFKSLVDEPVQWFNLLNPKSWSKTERRRADLLLNEFYKLHGLQLNFFTEISQNYKRSKILKHMLKRTKNELQLRSRRLTIEEVKKPAISISSIKKLFR